MRHVTIVGAGAELAQPVIRRCLRAGGKVTSFCRTTLPDLTKEKRHKVITGVDWAKMPDDGGLESAIDVLVIMLGDSGTNGKLGIGADIVNTVANNLTAAARALSWLVKHVKDGGNIVVVGSVVGRTGGYGCAAYSAAKAGLVGLVRSAALELAARKVCVNLLELGYVDAGMGARLPTTVKDRVMDSIPLKRFATPEEVVDMVEFLGKVTYMTGGVFPLTGGL